MQQDEVLIPGYTCYSVAASVVRAGLRIGVYDLDPKTLQPDIDSVKQMIAAYNESPIGYTLDVGPVDNKTLLIEVNDGWSLGLYPWGTMTNDKYVELITKRWCEIIHGIGEKE